MAAERPLYNFFTFIFNFLFYEIPIAEQTSKLNWLLFDLWDNFTMNIFIFIELYSTIRIFWNKNSDKKIYMHFILTLFKTQHKFLILGFVIGRPKQKSNTNLKLLANASQAYKYVTHLEHLLIIKLAVRFIKLLSFR